MVRTAITLGIICLYTLGVILYIHELTHHYWDISGKRLLYFGLDFCMIGFYLLDRKAGFVGKWHQQFNIVCIWLVMCNYGLWIMNWLGWLGDPEHPIAEKLIKCFSGSVFITTLIILICGLRHKSFR